MTKYIPLGDDSAPRCNRAIHVWISAPSIVSPGEEFSLRISLLGLDGFLATDFEGELLVKDNSAIEGLPEKLTFSKKNQGSLIFSHCSISKEGIYSFKVFPSKGLFPAGHSHAIWARSKFPYRLFWGDLHIHSVLGKCMLPFPKHPDFGYWYARDIFGHDFCSITDHASHLNSKDWEEVKTSAKRWDSPGKFVTILGFEGDYDGEDGGHFNLYFPSEEGSYKNFKLNAGGTLNSIFDFAREYQALAICHHTSRRICGRNFAKSHFGGQDIEPVMEVYSQWGSSEEYASSRPTIRGRHPHPGHYYRYALKHAFPLGVVGGSDSHYTTPGGSAPMIFPSMAGGKRVHFYPGGVTAVYAQELTRQSLFEALRARRCYATSFEKILVWIEAEGKPMGSDIEANSAEIDILVSSTYEPLIEVVVIKNGEVIARFGDFGEMQGFNRERKTFHLTWHDDNFSRESSYYVRATQIDGDMAWSSPIWIKPK